MSGKKESRFLIKLLTNSLKENMEKYDVDAIIRNMEVEANTAVNTAVNHGIDFAKEKIALASKRFISK